MEKLLALFGFDAVPDADQWKKWWSTKLAATAALAGSLSLTYSQLPASWRAALPESLGETLAGIGVVVTLLIPLFRAADQRTEK